MSKRMKANLYIRIKSAFAVLLCCTLVLGVAPIFNVRADSGTDMEKLRTAVALGLLDASAQNRAEETVTRGEFISAFVRLMGSPAPAKAVPFTDLSADSKYYDAICAAYDMGYVKGYGDGTVRETERITVEQAVKLLACCAGYSEMLDAGMTIERAAANAGICAAGEARDSSALTVAKAAKLLVNAGDSTIVIPKRMGVPKTEYTYSDDTVFGRYLDIYRIRGILDANEYTYLNQDGNLAKDFVRINGLMLKTSSGSVKNLLGQQVEAYYEMKKGSDLGLILCAYGKGNNILEIKAEDVIGYENGKLRYYNGKNKESSESFSAAAIDVIYNGRLSFEPQKEDFSIKSGSITLIDNNNDGKYEAANIMSYRSCVVEWVDRDNEKIYCKFGEGVIEFQNKNVNFISNHGENMYLQELAEWDVLSIAESKDKEVLNIVYILEAIDGTIEAFGADGDAGVITVDGADYQVVHSCYENQAQNLALGEEVMLYPDIDGKIAAVNFTVAGEEYGYLIAMGRKKGITPEISVKYMDKNGNVCISRLAEKIKVDGDYLKCTDEKDASRIVGLSNQMMLYKKNANGEVISIDTAYTQADDGTYHNLGSKESAASTLCKYYDGYSAREELVYKNSTKVFGAKVASGAATPVFFIPNNLSEATDSDYRMMTASSYFHNDTRYMIQAFRKSSDALIADVVIVHVNTGSGGAVAEDTAVSLVDKISRVVDEEGNVGYKLVCYNGTNRAEYYVKDDALIDGVTLAGESYKLRQGDIIKISTSNGILRALEVVYSAGEDKLSGSNPNNTSVTSVFRVQRAYVYQKSNNHCMTTTTVLEPGENYRPGDLENYELHNLEAYSLLVYDSVREKITAATPGSVVGFLNTGGVESSKIFIYDRAGNAGTIIIYQ